MKGGVAFKRATAADRGLAARCSLLAARCSLLAARCLLLAVCCSCHCARHFIPHSLPDVVLGRMKPTLSSPATPPPSLQCILYRFSYQLCNPPPSLLLPYRIRRYGHRVVEGDLVLPLPAAGAGVGAGGLDDGGGGGGGGDDEGGGADMLAAAAGEGGADGERECRLLCVRAVCGTSSAQAVRKHTCNSASRWQSLPPLSIERDRLHAASSPCVLTL